MVALNIMRKSFIIALFVAILFGGGYFYYTAQAVCPVPLSYSIGSIDDRFDMTTDEARVAVSDAESVWENATGRNLFTYDENGKLKINFVYDNRQQFVTAEGNMKQKLDATENMSDAIKDTYTKLISQYDELKASYQDRVQAYEENLDAYNSEVEDYNKKGGAPADVYASLSKQKKELDTEQNSLNELSTSLNTLVAQINDIGDKGNVLISTYNKGVNLYNQAFGNAREFTQGDYSSSVINIYTYADKNELRTVLAHELGHSLGLEHVEGTSSIMYYLIGGQPQENLAPSDTDITEFNRVCGNTTLLERLKFSIEHQLSYLVPVK